MSEQWKPIDGYPDYEVSDEGRVRRLTKRTSSRAGAILSVKGLRSGYPSVDLSRPGQKKRTYQVHRLVAAAFLALRDGAPEINHVNGVKADARAVNLEYVSSSENQQHAFDAGLQDCGGEQNGFVKLTWKDVGEIRKIAAEPGRPSYQRIADRFNVTESNIRAVVKGKTWNR